MKRIAINGFGRIGRYALRNLIDRNKYEISAINDLTDPPTLSHLLKYDSVHGKFPGKVEAGTDCLIINGKKIPVFSYTEIRELPWAKLKIDLVLECTGRFTDRKSLEAHLTSGAGKVILSAPANEPDVKTVVIGVNDHLLEPADRIVSNASCTTNCAAPLIQVLDQKWGVKNAYITTVHSYTGDQRLHDAPHKDLRRARAAALSIIPTSTGAAKAITRIFPHLEGMVGGCGMRVPVPNGSITDITCVLKNNATEAGINEEFKRASEEGQVSGILEFCPDPIVSIDIVGNPNSCVFDPEFTSVVGDMVKILGWYDNESGYSNRLVDLAEKMLEF